ncbi:MAG: transposase [Elusimicrobia bacterium]|nr:transposase [Elusimicrobiota bacterium]
MPRLPRGFHPGCVVHSVVRGNNRQAIFLDDEDRQRFLGFLKDAALRHSVSVWVFALMGNHAHLQSKCSRENHADFMQAALGPFARWFNAVHGRVGHLFEKRYYSRVISDVHYLHEAARYIHMNPVEAGLAAEPEDYPWSSFRAHLTGKSDGLVEIGPITEPFVVGGRFDSAAFRRFTVERFRCGRQDAPPWPPGWLERIAGYFSADLLEIRAGGRHPAAARARCVALGLLWEAGACSQEMLAALFGLAGRQSVWRSIQLAGAYLAEDARLRSESALWAAALRGPGAPSP